MKKHSTSKTPSIDMRSPPRYITPNNLSQRTISPKVVQKRVISPRCRSPRGTSPRVLGGRIGSPNIRVYSPNARMGSRAGSPIRNPGRYKHIKPIEKIKSLRSIKTSMLPSFIRVDQADIMKYALSVTLSATRTADTTTNESKIVPDRNKTIVNDYIRNQQSFNNDLLNLIFDSSQSGEEVLVSVGSFQLSRAELTCFQPGKALPDIVIDASLKCIKFKNTKRLKKRKVKESIYCLGTKYCKYLFQVGCPLPSRLKKNLLSYDYLIFPVFVGYWTILIVNIKGKSAKYFDPIGIEKNDNLICTQLFALLKREIKLNENKDIENTRWQRLEYERINEFEAYEHMDSSVYVLRQAFKAAMCKDLQVRPEIMPEFRNKMLMLLFKYGNKITY